MHKQTYMFIVLKGKNTKLKSEPMFIVDSA